MLPEQGGDDYEVPEAFVDESSLPSKFLVEPPLYGGGLVIPESESNIIVPEFAGRTTLHFTAKEKLLVTFMEGISSESQIIIEAALAHIAVWGSVERDAEIHANYGTLHIDGDLKSRAQVVTRGRSHVRGKTATSAGITYLESEPAGGKHALDEEKVDAYEDQHLYPYSIPTQERRENDVVVNGVVYRLKSPDLLK